RMGLRNDHGKPPTGPRTRPSALLLGSYHDDFIGHPPLSRSKRDPVSFFVIVLVNERLWTLLPAKCFCIAPAAGLKSNHFSAILDSGCKEQGQCHRWDR